MADPNTIMVPVGAGELIDKITILEIKAKHVRDEAAAANIAHELNELSALAAPLMAAHADMAGLKDQLQAVNAALWKIEDDIRDHERRHDFGDSFVALARSVYVRNDERARLKRAVNDLTGSAIVEEKLYAEY